jgi:hypothetical protein
MSERITKDEYEVWFESLAEMEAELPALIKRKNTAHWQRTVIDGGTGMYGGSRNWFGCDGGSSECFRLLRDGWPDLFKEMQPMLAQLRRHFALDTAAAVQTEVRRRKRRHMDSGDDLDMTRVWNGQLDTAWSKPVKEPRMSASQRYATIYVDSATSGATSAHDTLWRAATAMCMIEVLTRMGVNTEVWVGTTGVGVYAEHGAPRKFRSAVRVKQFTQPVNEDRMTTMVSSAFYRSWLFGTYMAGPWQTCSSLGMIAPQGMPKILADRAEKGERMFTIGYCLNEHSAQALVKSVIDSIQKTEAA